jgi:arsenate reductase (glutaredoxin)
MLKVLHNPRCGKSRNCLAFLDEKETDYQIIKYLENPLSKAEIKQLLKKLKLKPIAIVRQKESIWVEHFQGKILSDDAIIETLTQYPILIERPIVINGDNAYIAREMDVLTKKIR